MDQPSVPCSPRKSGAATLSPMTWPNGRKDSSVNGSTDRWVMVGEVIASSPCGPTVGMGRHPVPGDIHAPAYPHALVLEHMVEKAREPRRAARTTGQSHLQPDGHHLGRRRSLRVEDVESVPEIGVEILAGVEALDPAELHVVVVHGVGNDEVALAGHRDPVRQVVVVRVGVVEKAALFHHEPAGVRALPARVPAERPAAREPGEDLHGALQVRALFLLAHVLVVDPPPPMAHHLVTRLDDRRRGRGVAFQSHGDGVDRDRDLAVGEHAKETPEPSAAAVFVRGLHVHVAHAGERLGRHHLVQERLGLAVAVEDGALASLLVVHDDLEGQPRPARPLGIGRALAVTDEVPRVAHSYSLMSRGGGANLPVLLWARPRRTRASAIWTPQATGSRGGEALRGRRAAAWGDNRAPPRMTRSARVSAMTLTTAPARASTTP